MFLYFSSKQLKIFTLLYLSKHFQWLMTNNFDMRLHNNPPKKYGITLTIYSYSLFLFDCLGHGRSGNVWKRSSISIIFSFICLDVITCQITRSNGLFNTRLPFEFHWASKTCAMSRAWDFKSSKVLTDYQKYLGTFINQCQNACSQSDYCD